MPRNTHFSSPGRPGPFDGEDGLNLDKDTVRGALPFFNPTRARFRVRKWPNRSGQRSTEESRPLEHRAAINWRARDNRKGRHVLLVDNSELHSVASPTTTATAVGEGLVRMATQCPYWDVSYLVSVFFAAGCLIFIACGFFYWLPLAASNSEFPGETTIAGGITAFVGATLFQIGAVLLVFEACNENQTGCFGWALHQVFSGNENGLQSGNDSQAFVVSNPDCCKHHHQRGRKKEPLQKPHPGRKWAWWPSWNELKTHYIHEMGFVASVSLALGATIFYISGICALPGIFENMSVGVARGVYWLTYLLGGIIFIFSSILYMLETQPNWYTPAPRLLGWHIGFWNLVGSIGWTLAASLGYCTSSGCKYVSELTLIWASAAFLIGSLIQWYEALHKYPVEKAGLGVDGSYRVI